MPLARIQVAALALVCGACVHDTNDYPGRLELALDVAAIELDGAMAAAEQSTLDGVVISAEFVLESISVPLPGDAMTVTEDAIFVVESWREAGLVRTFVDLDGGVGDVHEYGESERAAEAAEVIREASLTLAAASRSAQSIVDDGRAFSAIVEASRYEVEVVARGRVFEVDVSPEDGSILDIDVEDDWGYHDCPHWGC